MEYLEITGWAGLVILLYVTAIWLLSLRLQDTSIVDIFWGLGFVLAALVFLVLADGWLPRRFLVVALVCSWGLRLSLHIAARNAGQPEDARYRAWREQHGGTWWWRSYVTVFLLQGTIMWVIALPLLSAQMVRMPAHWTWLDGLGLTLWLAGFSFEAIADYQLSRFKSDPANRGRVLDRGLWRYSRHPNYFGETLLWWGFGFLALSGGHYWVLVSPLLITVLLLKFSGVTLLERTLQQSKPAYADYVARTSSFVPWPPKGT